MRKERHHQAAGYVNRKDTEPTTYVANGENIKLDPEMNVISVTDMVSDPGSRALKGYTKEEGISGVDDET